MSIVVKDNGFEITEAPDEALISLSLIANHDSRAMDVHGDLIIFGTYPNHVTYRVVGWDAERIALVVEKQS